MTDSQLHAPAAVRHPALGQTRAIRFLPALLFGLLLLLFWHTLVDLAPVWFKIVDSSYGHGPAMVPIVMGLLWYRTPPKFGPSASSNAVWPLLALGSVLWAASALASVNVAQYALLPGIVALAFAAAFGIGASRPFWVPIALFYVALPVWQPFVDFVLWPATTWVSAHAVTLMGIPTFVEGHTVSIPNGAFEIAAACSGSHFFLIGLTVSCLVAIINQATAKQWFVLLATGIASSMAANWVRVIGLILVGHFAGMDHPLIGEHFTYGWIIFGVVNFAYCLWARRYLESAPVSPPIEFKGTVVDWSWTRVLGAVAIAAIGPVFVYADSVVGLRTTTAATLQVPQGSVQLSDDSASHWHPVFANADQQWIAELDVGGRKFVAYQNLYLTQEQGKELINEQNALLPSDWRQLGTERFGKSYTDILAADAGGQPWRIRYAYGVDRWQSNSPTIVKLRFGALALTLRQPAAGVVALAVRCQSSGCGNDSRGLDDAWETAAAPLLHRYANN